MMSKYKIFESKKGQIPLVLSEIDRNKWFTSRFQRTMIVSSRLIIDGVEKGNFSEKSYEEYFITQYYCIEI